MKSRAFTLIELLVVVLIIGILASIALQQYRVAVAKTRVVNMMPLLRAIADAENVYKLANGNYTLNLDDLDIAMPGGAFIDDDGKLVYTNYTCETVDWDAGSIVCEPHTAGQPYLEKYFNLPEFHCWTNSSDMGTQVCKSLSGNARAEYTGKRGTLYRIR